MKNNFILVRNFIFKKSIVLLSQIIDLIVNSIPLSL